MPDSMNRPHIAALLRVISRDFELACQGEPIFGSDERRRNIKAHAEPYALKMVSRLRQRADEIEGHT